MNNVLNKFAPIKKKLVTIRPAAPWINVFVKAAKQARRKAERLFRKTGLTIHKEIYKYHKNKTTKIINEEKKKYINEKISSSKNSKQLYSIFGKLPGKLSTLILPSDTPVQNLPDVFNTFFVDKISKIRFYLDSFNNTHQLDHVKFTGSTLNTFDSVSVDNVKKNH